MNKKKVLSSVLAAALTLGSMTAFAQENGAPSGTETVTVTIEPKYSLWDEYRDGVLNYEELPDGTYAVVGLVDEAETDIVIPETVNGIAVTRINERAFEGCSDLISVTIPNSIKEIGDWAFCDCSSLASLTIPDSVTSLGHNVLSNCIGLTSIDVDENNETYCSIDGVLFDKPKTTLIKYPASSKMTSYKIPDGVTSIGDWAFEYCFDLTLITIPDGVAKIGNGALYGCRITSITIPDGVTSIGSNAFRSCINLTEVTIPDSVTGIGISAFESCWGLKSVTLPNNASIGLSAFESCEGLTSITIPDGVTNIGAYAFTNCKSLTSINVGENNASYCSVDGVLFNKSKTVLTQYPAGKEDVKYIIPDSVTNIDASAFYGCKYLTSVTIPDGVAGIEYDLFRNCVKLTSVIMPDSITHINYEAFDYCDNLKDVYYSGTEEQWKQITIDNNNDPLLNATIHYNSTGPVGTPVEITVKAPEGMEISGQTATVTVNGETKPLTITDGMLDVSGLADGKYTFTFKANNCAPRDYQVTVSSGTATGLESGVKLHLFGDINGDGKLTLGDVLKANAAARNSKPLTGYDKNIADINGDGKISLGDVLKMNAHARNSKPLW